MCQGLSESEVTGLTLSWRDRVRLQLQGQQIKGSPPFLLLQDKGSQKFLSRFLHPLAPQSQFSISFAMLSAFQMVRGPIICACKVSTQNLYLKKKSHLNQNTLDPLLSSVMSHSMSHLPLNFYLVIFTPFSLGAKVSHPSVTCGQGYFFSID